MADENWTITSEEDLKNKPKESFSNKFLNWDRIKKHTTNVIILLIYCSMLAFVLYVGYFLWLTAMNENETKVLSRMQDIIIKTSGWGLFVLSYFRNGNKKKDED